MPLTELLRMISGEGNAAQERASNSSDPSPRPETDFCELIWENGHFTMQAQSSKMKKGPPTANDHQSLMHKSDARDASGLKMNHFSSMDSVLGDFPSVVPSSETGLGQDVDMVPWLSYPAEDSLHNDYNCDLLTQYSGVTTNDISTNNHLAFREKKSGCHDDTHHNSETLKNRDASKVDPHSVKYSEGDTSETPQFALSYQNTVLRSGVSDTTRDNVASRDSNSSSLYAFTNSRLQKLDAGQPRTSSSFTNFPHFSRSGVLTKASNLTVNTSKRLENDERRCTVTGSNPADSTLVNLASACSWKETGADCPSAQALAVDKNSELLKNQTDEPILAQRTIRKEDIMNDTQQHHAIDATLSKVVGGERNMKPVVAASSVCSGNSVDRASNERAGSKRKFRETTESEGPSEEVEEESVGAKKAAHARASSKRIRAAEVHNLSERRRRDRINEKMRALQELIPNCNKVDKASMLDEAIDYLKTLQLQLQMYSMGAGLLMQPMMVPPGMQPIHGAQMPHFSSMGPGIGMSMGFGTNMLDVNNGMKMMPFQSPHYPLPGAGALFHGIPGSSLQPFGHPGQGLQLSMQRPPVHPLLRTPLNMSMGMNVSGVGGSLGASNFVSPSIGKDSCPQVIQSNIPNIYMNQDINQATKEGVQPFASPHDRKQVVNASGTSLGSSGTNNAV